jgi:hypothetical protein
MHGTARAHRTAGIGDGVTEGTVDDRFVGSRALAVGNGLGAENLRGIGDGFEGIEAVGGTVLVPITVPVPIGAR